VACAGTRQLSLEMRHIQQLEEHPRCEHHEREGVSPGQQSRRSLGPGMTEKVAWHIVREYATTAGISPLAPHDLRRTCARLCHAAGGELDQIQFLLGHVSIQKTERYLGCKQRIRAAVNDHIGIAPSK